MPIKFNLTKYDMLSAKIKKLATTKKEQKEITNDDKYTVFQAILVASFASGHSWQTFKTLTSSQPPPLNTPEIKQEFAEAHNSKWKLVTPFNIVEVSTMNISDNAFSQWLFSNVEKPEQEDFKTAWDQLKGEFEVACDDIKK